MHTWTPADADVFVYSYKEGLLSRVAHDIKLRVRSFEIRLEDDQLEATFDPRSLEVVHAMKKGKPNPSALSPKDCSDVLANIEREILHPDRFSEITFRSTRVKRTPRSWEVAGTLALHGREGNVVMRARVVDSDVTGKVRIHQPAFGIVPFKAMMGTLKIKPDVEVEVRLSLPE